MDGWTSQLLPLCMGYSSLQTKWNVLIIRLFQHLHHFSAMYATESPSCLITPQFTHHQPLQLSELLLTDCQHRKQKSSNSWDLWWNVENLITAILFFSKVKTIASATVKKTKNKKTLTSNLAWSLIANRCVCLQLTPSIVVCGSIRARCQNTICEKHTQSCFPSFSTLRAAILTV